MYFQVFHFAEAIVSEQNVFFLSVGLLYCIDIPKQPWARKWYTRETGSSGIRECFCDRFFSNGLVFYRDRKQSVLQTKWPT